MTKDAKDGQRAIARLLDKLSDPEALEGTYANLILETARGKAASRPTPQAPMAAEGLHVSGNAIRAAGGESGGVAAGSEFGSDLYPQFQHQHTGSGLWLYPSAEDEGVLREMDNELEKLVSDAVE